jgi:CDP-glucose 4,6-dehydratase
MGDRQPSVGNVMSSLPEFYRGKKVLVTGHTGFKGGWLAVWLKLMGAEVIGFALPAATQPNMYGVADVAEGIVSILGDVRDLASVKKAFLQHNPDIVMHLAAQAWVRRSYREPVETYATNVMGTVHVLEAARATPSVRSIVVVTSDKCYENREWKRGYEETDAMGGHDPYSSSKGAAELVTSAYRRSFFSGSGSAAVGSGRAGNVIGGGDWSEDRLIPDIVRGISSGTPIKIRRPETIRPWQHVLQPVSGYLLLAQKLYDHGRSYADAWNFGPDTGESTTTIDLAERVRAAWGKGCIEVQPDSNAPHEDAHLLLNCVKAAQHLGWRPLIQLPQAVEWTVDWYRAFYERSSTSPRAITERQILAYMENAAS